MERVLGNDSNCVDAGANVGKFVREMVRLAPSGNHFAFEPLPNLAARLRDEFPSVHIVEVALADIAETARFRHVLGAEAFSGFERRPWDTYEEVVDMIDVQVAPLDDILPVDLPVRFMKADVEGAEYRLFRGAKRTLTQHKPFVAFELGSNQAEVFDLLTEVGLHVSLLDRWLSKKAPLDKQAFLAEVHSLKNWTFLAYPP